MIDNNGTKFVLMGAKPSSFKATYVKNRRGTLRTPSEYKDRDSLMKFLNEDDDVKRQSINRVKKCPQCNKMNAITLVECNSCGTELPNKITESNNIMFDFIHGVGYKLSIRLQKEDVLVYDDLLSLSRCHMNAIPTDVYIPDIRTLFNNPPEGLKVIKKLRYACIEAMAPFRKSKRFMETTFGKRWREAQKMSIEDFMESFVVCGFNCPPSQYHLHLQFIVLPLVPWHQHLYDQGNHFTKKRFFPYDFVETALRATGKNNLNWGIQTPIEDVFTFFEDNQLDYNRVHNIEYRKVEEAFTSCESWKLDDFLFKYYPEQNKLIKISDFSSEVSEIAGLELDGKPLEGPAEETLKKGDFNVLSSYGKGKKDTEKNLYYYKKSRPELLPEFQEL